MTEDNITALQHRSLPWRVDDCGDMHGCGIYTREYLFVAKTKQDNKNDVDCEANAAYIVKACNEHPKLTKQRDALLEALQPSCETKVAYMSEFHFERDATDEYGDEICERIPVPWTTIKDIMKAISDRAMASVEADNG